MIHIVAGYPRSGTSMMMQALVAGGLVAAYNPARDRGAFLQGAPGYEPAPGGLYELDTADYRELGFPLWHEGKLIKVLWSGLATLAPHDYRVVLMRRDVGEIERSHRLAFGYGPPAWHLYHYERLMDAAAALLRNRRDTELAVLDYAAVVRNPGETMRWLARQGWPIDAERAAAAVRPELYRNRLNGDLRGSEAGDGPAGEPAGPPAGYAPERAGL